MKTAAMIDPMREPQSPTLTIEDLAGRLAREMRIAAAIADDCQDALAASGVETFDHETITRVQNLDLLSQQLIEIGRVLERLVDGSIAGEVSQSLLDDVCLSDLKRRLSGHEMDLTVTVDADVWRGS
jgi:hypothetical protein